MENRLSTKVDASESMGSCFINGDGSIIQELQALTGIYIDNVRGVLKVTDVKPENFPSLLSFLAA